MEGRQLAFLCVLGLAVLCLSASQITDSPTSVVTTLQSNETEAKNDTFTKQENATVPSTSVQDNTSATVSTTNASLSSTTPSSPAIQMSTGAPSTADGADKTTQEVETVPPPGTSREPEVTNTSSSTVSPSTDRDATNSSSNNSTSDVELTTLNDDVTTEVTSRRPSTDDGSSNTSNPATAKPTDKPIVPTDSPTDKPIIPTDSPTDKPSSETPPPGTSEKSTGKEEDGVEAKMSGGQIAGIVFGVLLACIALPALAIYLVKWRRQRKSYEEFKPLVRYQPMT